jgi:hypothetical protein
MVHMHIGDFTQDVPESSNGRAVVAMNELRNAAHGTPPPPPPPASIEQLLATQNELMRVLMENLVQCVVCPSHHQPGVETSYIDFLVMHPPTFTKAIDLLEAGNWLRIIESSLGFCTALRSRRPCSQSSSFMDP